MIEVTRSSYDDVAQLREAYRAAAGCQIVHDSALSRGIADAYSISVDGAFAGYAGVFNRYYPGRLMEFMVLPEFGPEAPTLFEHVLEMSGATSIEAQTNMPVMTDMLRTFGDDIVEEKTLFEDSTTTNLLCSGAFVRLRTEEDEGPAGEWVLDVGGQVLGGGGFLSHYNPPYADVYMEVAAPARREGYGSYLVQELKRLCRQTGKIPAARCDPWNEGSRRTLLRAGFRCCGHLLVGSVRTR